MRRSLLSFAAGTVVAAGIVAAVDSGTRRAVAEGRSMPFAKLAELLPAEPDRKACYARTYDATHLRDHPKQRVISVEVRPGAAGNIATEAVTRMPPDGYTLLLVNSQNAINVALYEKLSFDFARDIAPVGKVETVPLVMEVHPSVPVKTIPEFIAYAKANPG